ncbi:hypothetical protein BKA83DRAFT_4132481 [Pisolithus microcarpus]|nr:hypothetical protein BKA83DRAFT_4132481 [Pisolithus microcarpus]
MGFLHSSYGGMGNFQLGSWRFSMGVEIPPLPEWDFSIPLMGGWGISNWAVGDSPWVWRFPNCQNGISPPLLWGDGESPIGQLEILHGCGDSPTARMGFLHPSYGGMGNLQLGSWRFSMGVEIPQLPEWDFSTPLMGGWGISNWAVGDSPWVWRFPNCQNGISPPPFMGGWGFSNWAVGDSIQLT